MLYGPHSEHFSDMSGRSRATQLFLPEGMLEQAIAARLQNDPMNLASKRRLLIPGRVAMHSLRQLIVELTQIIDNDEDAGVEPVCTSSLIKNLVDRIAEALCRDSSLASTAHDQLHASGCLLSRVRDIFEASGRESIQLYELCKELGVSARTLQIAFKQAYGISPMRYLKLRRLHAVRQRLITSVWMTSVSKEQPWKAASLTEAVLQKTSGNYLVICLRRPQEPDTTAESTITFSTRRSSA